MSQHGSLGSCSARLNLALKFKIKFKGVALLMRFLFEFLLFRLILKTVNTQMS